MHIKGFYLDGITSKGISARLELVSRQQKTLVIIGEDDNKQLHVFQLSNLDISSRIGDAPREINVDSGEQFITNDNDENDDAEHIFCTAKKRKWSCNGTNVEQTNASRRSQALNHTSPLILEPFATNFKHLLCVGLLS